MQKTKIEWCDYSWNPIKGLCPVGCWYCYARKIYKRFGLDETPKLVDRHELIAPVLLTGPRKRIFVCSTFELFHPVADQFRGSIFALIEHAQQCRPDLTFIILTKMPERIDRPMPENVWLGVSVTGCSLADTRRTEWLARLKAQIKFISFEPILAAPWLTSLPLRPDWIIAGRLTGHGKREDPRRDTIGAIVEYSQIHNIPVFLKNNLADIWGKSLVQEFPE